MSDPLAALSDEERGRLEAGPQPEWIEPMLATLHGEAFSDDDWIFERKLDGERCLAFRDGGRVRLLSRHRQDLGSTYPELARAVAAQDIDDLVLDGEVVAFSGRRTSFTRLQERMQVAQPPVELQRRVAVWLYVFDLLHVAGFDTIGLELRSRKKLLRKSLSFAGRLRFTPHRNRDGEAFFEDACGRGWEGLIAKRAGASYRHGRSREWLKLKCSSRQELVVGGFTEPRGERVGLGALLVGYYAGERFVYAGRVGSGFDNETLHNLRRRLEGIERETSPFERGPKPARGTHFVEPELVAEIAFTEWTSAGRLRHPRFLGLRRDTKPRHVVREGGRQ